MTENREIITILRNQTSLGTFDVSFCHVGNKKNYNNYKNKQKKPL